MKLTISISYSKNTESFLVCVCVCVCQIPSYLLSGIEIRAVINSALHISESLGTSSQLFYHVKD